MTPRSRQQLPEIEDRVVELRREGFGPTQIRRQLAYEFNATDVPSTRTIRRRLAELPEDDSGPWRVAEATPDEIASVLPVLAHVARLAFESHRGAAIGFGAMEITQQEARLIHRIRLAAPDVPVRGVWHLALRYIFDFDREELRRLYDLFLAIAPWRSGEARDEYERFVERSGLSRRDQVLALIVSDNVAGRPGKGRRKEKRHGHAGTRQAAGTKVDVRRRTRKG